MKALRLAGFVWIAAAGLAGALGVFLLGMGEHPEEGEAGQRLVVGAILAAGTGIAALLRPTAAFARWSVVLAAAWVTVAIVLPSSLNFESDRILFHWVPAALAVVAGIASIPVAVRR